MPPTISLRRRGNRPALALLLALTFLVAGCGDDTSAHDQATAEQSTADKEPASIVSLSPSATEMLWAIGADDQVVAVDDQSDYPADVPTTELSGYEPNVEAILGYEPDLVVASADTGDLVSGLKAADVPVLLLPAATGLDDSYAQIEKLGAATGHVEQADKVVDDMQTRIKAAVAKAPDAAGMTYFHELGPDLYTVTGDTFIGEVYGLFGLRSIAEAKGDDYPQLSSEYVASADPDLVLVGDNGCCGVTARDVRERPGWEQMSAVRDGGVHVVDEDITSRWGPRVVEFVELVARLVAEHAHHARSAA